MKKRIIKVISILILSLIVLYGYYFLNLKFNFYIPCLFYEKTGLYCPGCGITRCIFSIINGNYKEAFNYNRLVFIMLPFLIAYFIYSLYLYIFNKKDNITKKIPNQVFIIVLLITILFGIIRNTNYFSYLKP